MYAKKNANGSVTMTECGQLHNGKIFFTLKGENNVVYYTWFRGDYSKIAAKVNNLADVNDRINWMKINDTGNITLSIGESLVNWNNKKLIYHN